MTAPAELAGHARHVDAPSSAPRPQHGFLLWVGIDPEDRAGRAADIIELAEALGELARELLPTAETYTALSLGEAGRTGRRPVELDGLGDRLAQLELVDRAREPRLTVDLSSRRVTLDGLEQRLTYKEFELLAHLVAAPGRVVGRSELFASVWRSRPTEPGSRTIDVHVRRLRDKLGLHHEILTVRGAGYRFEASARVEIVKARRAG